jgi:hypothetical protein
MTRRAAMMRSRAARLPTPRFNPMQSFCQSIACCAMAIGLAGASWWCLTTTLDDMTRIDCQAGVVRACDALR